MSLRFNHFLLLLSLLFLSYDLHAQNINYTTVHTDSECQSSGQIEIIVDTIVSGGKTVSKIFYSLEPIPPSTFAITATESLGDMYNLTLKGIPKGNYRTRVLAVFSDNSSENELKNVSIGGNYVTPAVSAHVYVESLIGCDTTGVMFVRVIGGKNPMNVQVTNYTGAGVSSVGKIPTYNKIVDPNTTDYYFTSLPSGSYSFKVTDDCNSTQNIDAELSTVNLNIFDWFQTNMNPSSSTFFKWVDNCNLTVSRIFSTRSNHINSANLKTHYGKHPSIKLKIINSDSTYSSVHDITAVVAIPVEYTKNQEFTGMLQIIDPCGQVIQTYSQIIKIAALNIWTLHNPTSIMSNAYPLKDNNNLTELGLVIPIYRGNELHENVINWYSGQEYRVTFNSTTSAWKTITDNGTSYDTLTFSTGFADYNTMFNSLSDTQLRGVLEIKTKCGGISKEPFEVRRVYLQNHNWTCGQFTDYVFYFYVLALPAKINLKNTATNLVYSVDILKLGYRLALDGVPAGTYEQELLGADGYSHTKTITLGRVFGINQDNNNNYDCEENKSYFRVSDFNERTRIKLISSPVPYYFDKMASFWTFGPDNGKAGVIGDYKFEVTDACGVTSIIEAKLTRGLVVNTHSIVKGASDCRGMNFTVNADVHSLPNTFVQSYYTFVSAPSGFVKPPQNVPVGQNTKLNLKGTYIVGLTTSTTSTSCNLRLDTITYDGSGVEIDMNRSFAYICQGDANGEGKINAKAKNGIGPYRYYLSAVGTGGLGVEGRPHVSNTTGEFYNENLISGQQYDITIIDACNNITVQTFQIINLTDYKLAYAAKETVCVGQNIQFSAMGLPNPTFKWYDLNGNIFSTAANPIIPNAQLTDKGKYKVEITSDLCGGAKTDVLFVDINVIETPTLTVLSGAIDQDVCFGTSMQNTVIKWGGSADDISISGLNTNEYTKDMLNKTVTIRSISSSKTYTISTTGGCDIVSLTGKVTAYSKPSISGAATHYFCLNEAISFYYSIYNTNSVDITGLPPELKAEITASRITFSGTLSSNAVHNVNLVLTNTIPNHPCPVTNFAFVLNAGFELTLSTTTATCGTKGKIAPNIVGGSAPFLYSLDGVNWKTNTSELANLLPGTYTVYVKDRNNCIQSAVTTIIHNSGAPAGSMSFSDGPLSYGIAEHALDKCIYLGNIDPNQIQALPEPSIAANTSLNDNAIVGIRLNLFLRCYEKYLTFTVKSYGT